MSNSEITSKQYSNSNTNIITNDFIRHLISIADCNKR